MKKTGLGMFGMILAGAGLALAMTPDVDHGKALFADPSLGGGTTGRSCQTCHEGGDGISGEFVSKAKSAIAGQGMADLAAVVNYCIERPLSGTAIDPQGQDMLDLVAYIASLK